MAARFKKAGPYRPTFIKEWRQHRGLSQERLADRIDMTAANLSRIENGLPPYSQDFLEACAEAVNCEPADLLMRNPADPEGLWSVWDQLRPAQRPQALAIIKTLRDTGTG